jgi:RNA polymerase sigma-70 factor (ECF subfamily)
VRAGLDRHSAMTEHPETSPRHQPENELDLRLATLWRVESPRVIARLVRQVGDLDTAEELAQDVFVAAIEKWRQDGVPDNPAAWLNTTARFLAVDRIRRRDTQRGKYHLMAASQPQALEHDLDKIVDGDLADDLLGLIFMACHPILSPDARSALTLKLVCGLSTDDVARAFLTPAPTIAQRIVRAKRTLAAAKVRFELPPESERTARLDAVREVIYWSSTKATRPPAATSGSAATCARRRCGSAGCWPRSRRPTPRRWAYSP